MTDSTFPKNWEKAAGTPEVASRSSRWVFMAGTVIILGAVAFLIVSGMVSGASLYTTVEDVLAAGYTGQTVRLSGAVIGDTIQYDTATLNIDFVIAHIPVEPQDLSRTLYEAANDPNATRLQIHIKNQVKPDLLEHEAQAILTGKLGADGVFYASELLLKCPSRYGEANPGQELADPGAGK